MHTFNGSTVLSCPPCARGLQIAVATSIIHTVTPDVEDPPGTKLRYKYQHLGRLGSHKSGPHQAKARYHLIHVYRTTTTNRYYKVAFPSKQSLLNSSNLTVLSSLLAFSPANTSK
jgi:hypothetical protein